MTEPEVIEPDQEPEDDTGAELPQCGDESIPRHSCTALLAAPPPHQRDSSASLTEPKGDSSATRAVPQGSAKLIEKEVSV